MTEIDLQETFDISKALHQVSERTGHSGRKPTGY